MAFRWYANQKNPAGEFLMPSNYNRGGYSASLSVVFYKLNTVLYHMIAFRAHLLSFDIMVLLSRVGGC